MRGVLIFVFGLAACAGTRYRTELVGTGNGMVSSRASGARSDIVAAPGSGGVQLARGTYDVVMHFDVPRAQLVDWKLVCPGAELTGHFGTSATHRVRVTTSSDGVCALQVAADDDTVRASFRVTRIRDLDVPERDNTVAYRTQADGYARSQARAIYARQEVLAALVRNGADVDRRWRKQSAESRSREERLDGDAARAQRRDLAALQTRANIEAQLVALGAKARPAMPPPKVEDPGAVPFEGAEWVAGYWSWESGAWAWEDGSWMEPSLFDDSRIAVENREPIQTGERDHRRTREHTRDHRDGEGFSSSKWDALKNTRPESSKDPVVRDHRSEGRGEWTPNPRYDDKNKDDDDKPIVRDHRH